MKKSVLALAVIGTFAGTASAQSSVTLYGRVETSIAYTKLQNGDNVTRLSGGNSGATGADPIGGSRWGLRGTEDLGGGLSANFVLESGFRTDTGEPSSTTGKFFDRQSWVSIASKDLGEIRLGRQQTMTRELGTNAYTDISGEGELNVVDTNGTSSARPLFQNFGTRVDNAVTYVSPSFSGLQFRVLVAAGEQATADQEGLLATYQGGPVRFGIAYEQYSDGPGQSGSYNKVATVGGSYNFGAAIVLASYQNTKDLGSNTAPTLVGGKNVDHDAYNVGLLVPFNTFQFLAQYTKATVKQVTGDADLKKYGASLRYYLSKRTVLYGVYTYRDPDQPPAVAGTAKESDFAIGIGHAF